MFELGQYIVVLKDDAKINNWQGYIFKQKYQCAEIRPKILMDGKENNSYCYSDFTNTNLWRYATQEEIAEYERLGKPFDVTTIVSVPVNNDYTYLVKFLKKLGIK